MPADDHDASDLERALLEQLTGWGLADSAEGAAVLDIARRLASDGEELRPAAAAMLHAQLRSQLVDLRKLAPTVEHADGVADLRGQYEGLRVVGE